MSNRRGGKVRTFYDEGPNIRRELYASKAFDDVRRFLIYGAGQYREIRARRPLLDYEENETTRLFNSAGLQAATRDDHVSSFGYDFLSIDEDDDT